MPNIIDYKTMLFAIEKIRQLSIPVKNRFSKLFQYNAIVLLYVIFTQLHATSLHIPDVSQKQSDPFSSDNLNHLPPDNLNHLPFIFVGLGADCATADMLRYYQMRKAAFPFDWIVSTHEGLISLLESDFLPFFNSSPAPYTPSFPWLLPSHQYGFNHDFPPSDPHAQPIAWAEERQKIMEKFHRRIERFRSLRNFHGTIIFIRAAFVSPNSVFSVEGDVGPISFDQALELKDALTRYFPSVHFILAIINQDPIVLPNQTIENVYFFDATSSPYIENFLYILPALILTDL